MVRTEGNKTSVLIRDLEGSSTYYMSLRAYNSAGVGPQSSIVNVTTKKPRKDSTLKMLLANGNVLLCVVFSLFLSFFLLLFLHFTLPLGPESIEHILD